MFSNIVSKQNGITRRTSEKNVQTLGTTCSAEIKEINNQIVTENETP